MHVIERKLRARTLKKTFASSYCSVKAVVFAVMNPAVMVAPGAGLIV
jgi:hypothetical protein